MSAIAPLQYASQSIVQEQTGYLYMMNKTVLVGAIALIVAGCENPATDGKFQILTTPELTPTAISSPKPSLKATPLSTSKPVAASPTPKASERIYIPVYQNPIPKKIPVTPISQPKQTENKPAPVTNGSAIPAQSGSCKELRARGIENIDVKANPWASKLDRDKDGIACESN